MLSRFALISKTHHVKNSVLFQHIKIVTSPVSVFNANRPEQALSIVIYFKINCGFIIEHLMELKFVTNRLPYLTISGPNECLDRR